MATSHTETLRGSDPLKDPSMSHSPAPKSGPLHGLSIPDPAPEVRLLYSPWTACPPLHPEPGECRGGRSQGQGKGASPIPVPGKDDPQASPGTWPKPPGRC